jgi:hypothetical protein
MGQSGGGWRGSSPKGGAELVLAVKSAELAKEPLARFGATGELREVDPFPRGATS